ncbi:MAG: transposase, partial [Proteobacteria bacterium]|nr:transposase [Pseudomonadota bacterium]
MHYIKAADRQQFTFIQVLDDLVGPDNPVRVIDTIVDAILEKNPQNFSDKGQSPLGRRAYSPGTFLKLYIYGYLNGISSSRKLETETHRNIELIWLLGNLKPDFKTIADYRKDNGKEIKLLTRRFREFLRDQGLIRGKTVGIDGTRVKANADRSMLTAKKIERRIKSINEKIEDYLGRLMENDKREDILDELDVEDGS